MLADKPFGQWNRFIITMVGDRVSVVLNGHLVIDRAVLAQAAPRGAIALQNALELRSVPFARSLRMLGTAGGLLRGHRLPKTLCAVAILAVGASLIAGMWVFVRLNA